MVMRTKDSIIAAFNELITKHNLEDITVEMICEIAQISRTTFYRYYKDKYEVMNDNYKRLLDHYVASDLCHSYMDLFEYMYLGARTIFPDMARMFRSVGANSFSDFIYNYSLENLHQITIRERGTDLTEDEVMQCDLFCWGLAYMYEKWIEGKYDIPIRKAAYDLYDIFPTTLKYRWKNSGPAQE